MTAAAIAPVMGRPVCSVDGLTVAGYRTTDALGREWGMDNESDKGWTNSPGPRTKRENRPNTHGAFRSVAYRDVRQFTWGGFVACPTPAVRERTELELASLCSDPGQLYEFRRRTETFDQTMLVELDDEPIVEMSTIYTLRWLFTFAAPDPRKHDAAWQDPICNPPQNTVSGLEFGTNGLDFSGAGLDFGTAPGLSQQVQVANHGSAPAFPLFKLTGPLSLPTIVHVESGRNITYAAEVAAGEVVRVNCDDFDQRGFRGHSVQSSIRGNVRSLLTVGTEWPRVDPGTVATFALRSYGAASAELMCSLRSAWV